jgi:hypothetical protein
LHCAGPHTQNSGNRPAPTTAPPAEKVSGGRDGSQGYHPRLACGRQYMTGDKRGDDRREESSQPLAACRLGGVCHCPLLTRDRRLASHVSANVRHGHYHAAN